MRWSSRQLEFIRNEAVEKRGEEGRPGSQSALGAVKMLHL